MSGFVPIWCKSNYSFLEGASHPDELIVAAAGLGYAAIAITDREGMYGIVQAHLAAREHGIKLVVGSELSVYEWQPDESDSPKLLARLLLLARSREGYARLCALITRGRRRRPKGESRIYLHELLEHAEDLIAVWLPCSPMHEESHLTAANLKEHFGRGGRSVYLGIARHRLPGEAQTEALLDDFAHRHGLRMLALPETLYHDRTRRPLQDVMTCIREGVTLDEAETLLKPNAEYGLKSPQEISELYADRPELLAASGEIAESCRFSLSELEYRYPSEKLPEGFSSSEWLRSITMEGARERYRGRIPPDVLRQLERELELIHELGYCGYFLTMWEIVQFCRREKILCQGRGSAANSAVCYCLGITAVDPVRMELLFERFISRERAEPPDIDLDIEHNRREEVIQHMYERYGRDRAAMVANVIRYRRKSAVREVGKVLGISPTAADRVSRLIPHGDGDLAAVLAEAGIDNERYADLLRRLVEEIRDMPRHLSIHPGGFLLGSEPVTSLVPVENATMTDRTVIQWDKYDVEAMNLFKVDLLGLGALSHLRYCFDLLKEHYGKDLAMHRIPAGDQAVFRMLTAADTVGVFQLESRAQMAMLPRLKPRVFYDLVIEVSIVRPGPITGGMVHPYLRRRAGEEAAEYPHPALESVLRKTLGVPLFQEQVMKLAVIAADYSPGEADQLRRDMAAWRRSGAIEKHRETIIERMMAKGIAKEFAERVFDQIRGFGEYGFPESHAASFALIAYCTAWMKTHHHAVFSCALLNAWPMGFYAPSTVVEDAKRHGIQVFPVDVLLSPWMCTIEDGAIRMGLRYVKGLGEADWALVQAGRRAVGESSKGGGREKLRCFVEASSLDQGALDALARAGAFRSLGLERRSSLWEVLGTARRRTQQSAYRDSGETEDFLYLPEDRELTFQALSDFESIGWDYARTGHSTAGHPLSSLRKILTERGFPSAAEVAELRNGSNVGYAGLVICRQRPETAGGTLFMTLEDETGFVNLIIWKRVFADFRSIILTAPFLGVEGKLQTDGDTVHLIVSRCFRPELPRNPAAPASRNFH